MGEAPGSGEHRPGNENPPLKIDRFFPGAN
jgi:hypothetical protein